MLAPLMLYEFLEMVLSGELEPETRFLRLGW
jgi:hypothetical protein